MSRDPQVRGAGLAALAETVAKLPAELRMGAEAAETFGGITAVAGYTSAESMTYLADGAWSSSVPVKVDRSLPANVWTLVDGAGRGLIAGVLNPPPARPGRKS